MSKEQRDPHGSGFVRGFIWGVCFWIIVGVLLLGWSAFADTDAQGRTILHGTAHQHPAPHHSGGGPTGPAARYFLRIADQGPFRVSGRWFSSGTMVLALLAGNYVVPGSCLDPHVILSFHHPAGPRSRLWSGYLDAFLPTFGEELFAQFESGEITYLRQRHYTAYELLDQGYPVCED
jgi:hypothetical protein